MHWPEPVTALRPRVFSLRVLYRNARGPAVLHARFLSIDTAAS